MKTFRERLGKEWLFFDGGFGTYLIRRGLKAGELTESWNLSHPDEVLNEHKAFLQAGADIINTNTFGANRLKFPDQLEEVITSAVHLARQARAETGREDAFIALDLGPTGRLLEPMGDLSFNEAVSIYQEAVEIGVRAGVDLILIETMTDTMEAKAAILAAKENSELPVVATVTFNAEKKMLTGADVPAVVALFEGLGVDALGLNCSLGPKEMKPLVKQFVEYASIPVVVTPNAGLPVIRHGQTVYPVRAEEFAQVMGEIADMGVQVMGGCCGTTPEHVRLMIDAVRKKPFKPIEKKNLTMISSYSHAYVFGKKTAVIGERINPTGKKRFQQALKEQDMEYILAQGVQQEEAGAEILDVNVGLPDIDEAKTMRAVVENLQAVTDLPLQLDTSDGKALEEGLRHYNGCAMINSVNGRQEVMDTVFPLAKKYGGVIVALPLDEKGIPASAEGRIAIARRILQEAEKYGIGKNRMILDGLTMTVSADQKAGNVTLETIDMASRQMGLHTVLGVSNVSFGLPNRPVLNAFFLAMAMSKGLSAAMINPNKKEIMLGFRTACALLDQDPNEETYIQTSEGMNITSDMPQCEKPNEADGSSLYRAVIKGMKKEAEEITRTLIREGKKPMSIIDEEVIPALDTVGKGFEKGTVFLPQLLMSADAATAATIPVKEAMAKAPAENKGTVILATVKGDIHDIGKNIVRIMLENYGYEVIDLGRDVDKETIVTAALEKDVKLVGLSALMTTTVPAMEETIALLHEKKPDVKVMVGGAVLTQEAADRIHADAYGKDAMAAVRYADQVFGTDH